MSSVPINPPLKITRRKPILLRGPEIIERFTSEDGVACVRVPLSGKSGYGYSMTLDESDWDAARAKGWPFHTIVQGFPTTHRPGYVVTCSKPISSGGKQVVLARFILDAQAGEVVIYENGDEFDLRRVNLRKITREQAMIRVLSLRNGPEAQSEPEALDVPW